MSLLIFNSGNRISQGVIKRIYTSGAFERIICADLYPHYWSIQRYLKFKEELDTIHSKTILDEVKISEKSDLSRAIKKSSHVLYVTHNYYSLTPSKLNLIKTTAELSKGHVQKLVCLTPVEFDHFGEKDPFGDASLSEKQAKEIYPDLVHLKSDLTFGSKSGVVTKILKRIAVDQSLYFNSKGNQQTAPIHADDVAAIAEMFLTNDIKGKSYKLEGPNTLSINELLSTLEKYMGKPIKFNSSLVEKIIPPTSRNLISEKLYAPCYSNLTALLKNYRSLGAEGFENIKELAIKLKTLEETYKEKSAHLDAYLPHNDESSLETYIKGYLY